MKNILNKLKKYAHWKYILIGFGLILIFNMVLFPAFLEEMHTIAPNASGPFDLEFFYTYDQAVAMLESYTEEGRSIYATSEITTDILYPITYGITFTLLLLLLLPLAFPDNTKIQALSILPFAVVITDFFENTGIVLMLQTYPEEIGKLSTFTSSFSSIKWSLIGVLMFIIISSSIKILFNRLRNE